MNFRKIILISFSLISVWADLNADTIYLKNGRSIDGIIISDNDAGIELEIGSGTVTFPRGEIDRVTLASAEEGAILRKKWEQQRMEFEGKIVKKRLEEERKPKKVEFTQRPQGITVSAILNGRLEASLLLDTGASLVLISKKISQELGIGFARSWPDIKLQVADGRQVLAKRVMLKSIKTQGVEATNVEAAILMEESGDLGFGDGLLGMSFLKRFNFKVDQKEKKLILEKLE